MFNITETDRYNKISESGLALCRTPRAEDIGATKIWAALPHRKLWAHLIEALAENGYPILDSPEIFVDPTGLDVLGGMQVKGNRQYEVNLPSGRRVWGGYSQSIVFRNNNGGQGSLKLAAGASVWICANGCISGRNLINCRHTVGLDWRGAVDSFCRDLDIYFQSQRNRVQGMIDTPLNDEQAAHWLIERRRTRRLPACVLDNAWNFWRRPPHEEFEGRNQWSLYNAVTEASKGTALRSQARALEMV